MRRWSLFCESHLDRKKENWLFDFHEVDGDRRVIFHYFYRYYYCYYIFYFWHTCDWLLSGSSVFSLWKDDHHRYLYYFNGWCNFVFRLYPSKSIGLHLGNSLKLNTSWTSLCVTFEIVFNRELCKCQNINVRFIYIL